MSDTGSSTPAILSGIVPPLCTPLTADGEVDTRSLERLVDRTLSAGADGIFALGSTGEVAFLTDQQRGTVIETVVAAVDGTVPVLVGVIDMTTWRVREHIAQARALGADGVVVTAPFYTRTHVAEVERHFRLLHESAGIPLYAYDIPVSTGTKLDPEMLLRLARDGVIAGVKDSSGDDAALRRLVLGREEAGLDGFSVLTGSELTVDAALAFGVDGCVPGLGNVDPAGYVRLYRAARAGDAVAAREEQERLIRLFQLVDAGASDRMGRGSSALGAFKAALALLGVIDCGRTADPYIPLSDDEIQTVDARLKEASLS